MFSFTFNVLYLFTFTIEIFIQHFLHTTFAEEDKKWRNRHHHLPLKRIWFRREVSWEKAIVCVHVTSSNSEILNQRATKGFILIRHKKYQVYSCLHLSSPIPSFVWKPAHFEFRSCGDAWHNSKIAFVEKYTLISFVIFGHFRSLSIRKSAFVNIFGSV